jgi:hypothetical protein
MYYNETIEALTCNYFCGGKAVSIPQPECLFAAVSIQHAMNMSHVVICGLTRSKTFFHIIS